ncbi:hypothetical protein RSAG8_02632, partial [Rhizoctonia solani AG-8 WAC10335]
MRQSTQPMPADSYPTPPVSNSTQYLSKTLLPAQYHLALSNSSPGTDSMANTTHAYLSSLTKTPRTHTESPSKPSPISYSNARKLRTNGPLSRSGIGRPS